MFWLTFLFDCWSPIGIIVLLVQIFWLSIILANLIRITLMLLVIRIHGCVAICWWHSHHCLSIAGWTHALPTAHGHCFYDWVLLARGNHLEHLLFLHTVDDLILLLKLPLVSLGPLIGQDQLLLILSLLLGSLLILSSLSVIFAGADAAAKKEDYEPC